MFGSSNPAVKDDDGNVEATLGSDNNKLTSLSAQDSSNGGDKNRGVSPGGQKSSEDTQTTSNEKKRRSSGVSKAKDIFSNAKHSFHLHGAGSPTQTSGEKGSPSPIQKLGRTDPALSVPQGSLNNSAGESQPGPRSTFRVGVTEDKNKKCRRTMEDTHAYLYNFLSTPAPAIGDKNGAAGDSTSESQLQHVVETDNGYFAIFDGHAGTFAADWCGKKLHLLLEDTIRKNPNTPIPELLDQTFTLVDQQLEKLPLKNSGCTAVIAVLRWEDRIPNPQSATGSAAIAPAAAAAAAKASAEPGSDPGHGYVSQTGSENNSAASPAVDLQSEARLRESATRQRVLYTANVGDARIVLCRNGRALRLSYDHKGSDENEGRRVANAGGLILNNRVNGVLAVTRALGDAYMKDLVTGHPYTTETVVQPDQDEFLILACDGLWDVCTDQEAVDLVRHVQDPQAASKMLVEHALARFSTDNLSCMIVRFDNKALKARKQESAIGVEGDPPTRQPGGVTEAEALVANAKKHMNDDMDVDKKISDSIAEEDTEVEGGPGLDPEAATSAQRSKA